MKRRTIAIMLLVALVLTMFSGCGKKEEPVEVIEYEPVEVVPEIIEPTPIPDPVSITGKSLVNDYKLVYCTISRGENIKIVGEYNEEHYLVEYGKDFRDDPVNLIVEKKYIKTDNAAVEPYVVYARTDASIYVNAMCGEDALMLKAAQNTEFTVLDELNGILYVEWTETDESGAEATFNGFVSADNVSDTYITAVYYDYGGGGGDYGGGGGGGYEAPSYGYDGGDIAAGDLCRSEINTGNNAQLTFLSHVTFGLVEVAYAAELEETEETEEVIPESGVCFSDDVPAYAGILKFGDPINVITEFDAETTAQMFTYGLDENGELTYEEIEVGSEYIFINNCICEVPACIVRMPDKDKYEAWDAYIQKDVIGYACYDLSDEGEALGVNTVVSVIDEVLGVLVVTTEDGALYYVTPNSVSEEEYVAPYVAYDYGWGGGGDYGGGGGGGEVVDSWTAPVL